MCSFISVIRFAVCAPGFKSSALSKAKILKKYLCVPEGGHGPPYPVLPKLEVPSTHPAGELFSAISEVSGLMFHAVQCTQVFMGASGSSTIITNDFAPAGIS